MPSALVINNQYHHADYGGGPAPTPKTVTGKRGLDRFRARMWILLPLLGEVLSAIGKKFLPSG
jgi:hypothetical protein